MPSPFPGMNPYLEQRKLWRDFHQTFLQFVRLTLVPQVRPRYFVEFEESLYLDPAGGRRGPFAVADVAVAGPAAGGPAGEPVAAPVVAVVPVPRPVRRMHRRLVVRDSHRREAVAVVELLSPSEKRAGKDRERYLAKRAELLRSDASLVELDLLRGGRRMPIDGLPGCAYYALVGRRAERPRVGLWPLGVRDPLPTVPVPLRPGEAEPTVDLQAVLHRVHDDTGYADRIYADGRPDPPLSADDAAWAAGLVPAGGG